MNIKALISVLALAALPLRAAESPEGGEAHSQQRARRKHSLPATTSASLLAKLVLALFPAITAAELHSAEPHLTKLINAQQKRSVNASAPILSYCRSIREKPCAVDLKESLENIRQALHVHLPQGEGSYTLRNAREITMVKKKHGKIISELTTIPCGSIEIKAQLRHKKIMALWVYEDHETKFGKLKFATKYSGEGVLCETHGHFYHRSGKRKHLHEEQRQKLAKTPLWQAFGKRKLQLRQADSLPVEHFVYQ